MSWRERTCLIAAWILLALARAAIAVLPFAVVRRWLGEHARSHAPPRDIDHHTVLRARRIGAMLSVAARHTPWRSDCYPRALAARALLVAAGMPHTVWFGLRRDQTAALRAHAWVTVDGVVVAGGDVRDYTAVRSFTWVPRSHRTKADRWRSTTATD